jgi:glucose/arabinose dehydrogenase
MRFPDLRRLPIFVVHRILLLRASPRVMFCEVRPNTGDLMNARTVALLASTLLGSVPLEAAFPPLKLELVCKDQVNSPIAMVPAGDGSGRMFIADQRGKIRIFRNGMLEPGAFLDIGAKLCTPLTNYDERGLLGLAFHPGYANAASPGFRRFYVFYIANSPLETAPSDPNPVNSRTVVAEYKVSSENPDVADAASERLLLTFDKPQFNHAGGGLEFGPDGLLYFTVGDGGGSQDNEAGHTGGASNKPATAKGNAQDLTRWMGKLHRIDPLGTNGSGGQYGIPADNPYAASPNGERPEIYAFGLRNTWRFSFDSRPGGTGRLFAADVGQGEVEEIDIITKGANLGWRNKEGNFIPTFSVGAPAMSVTPTEPIAQYAHPGVVKGSPGLPQLGISCTGGYIYRGSAIPALAGKYVFGDFSTAFSPPNGTMLGLEETSPGVWVLSSLDILGGNPIGSYIQAFGQDESGELYVLTRQTLPPVLPDPATQLPSGRIYKIVPVPPTNSVNIQATKDNTMYSEFTSNSNGAGAAFFAGTIANSANHRRALLAFPLTAIPSDAVVAAATLTLQCKKVPSLPVPALPYRFALHRLLADWGQGSSVGLGTGSAAVGPDATWLKPFFNQPGTWISEGGDFTSNPSATSIVSTVGSYTWSSTRMASDLNAWRATPAGNFGWLLKADKEGVAISGFGLANETTITLNDTVGLVDGMFVKGTGIADGARIATGGINVAQNIVTLTLPNAGNVAGQISFDLGSAREFASREDVQPTDRPRLTVNYVPAPVLTHRQAWEKQNFFVGEYINDTFDTDNDGLPNGIEYAWGLPSKTRNQISDGMTVNGSSVPGGGPMTVTFRRDPLATDLTYRLEGTSDLVTWTVLAQSVDGGTPTGPGFVSESDVAGQSPFKNVVVTDPTPAGGKRFFRLRVIR